MAHRRIGGERRQMFGPTLAQPFGAAQMHRQVSVAQAEPIFAAQFAHRPQHTGGIVGAAPSRRRVVDTRQVVDHRINVGADGQPPMLKVIAGVDHDGKRARGQDRLQPGRQFCAANATGQRHYTGKAHG